MHVSRIALILGIALTGCLSYERSLQDLAPNARRLMEILDVFDNVDTSRMQFVRFTVGHFRDEEPGDPRPIYRFGFLEKTEGGRFQVRHLHLMRDTYAFSPEVTLAWERVGYETWSFREFIKSRSAEDASDRSIYVSPQDIFERGIEDIILARDCLRRGMFAESSALIGHRLEGIPDDLGRGLNHLLSLRFRDPAFTREQLLGNHRRWLELFPEHKDREEVAGRAAILERMVDEDRGEGPGRPGSRPTSEALVRGLRNDFGRVNRHQLWTWMLRAMWDPPSGKCSPDELIERGFEAVPALIAAIGDERFTRCAAYNSRFGGSIEPVTIDWIVREILQEISGLPDNGKEGWTEWFADVKVHGEQAVLAELVVKGEHRSVWAVDRLLKKWPHRIDALIRCLRENDKVSSRDLLVQRFDKHWSSEAAACLRDEIKHGKDTQGKIAASEVLWKHGDRTGLEWGLRIWPAETLVIPEEKWESDSDNRQERRLREELAEFLIDSGDVEAFRVLSRALPSRPEFTRNAVLDQLTGECLRKQLESAGELRPELESAIAALIEPFLIEFTGKWSVRWFQYKGRSLSLSNPRSADLAGCVAVDCWPDLFRFDPKAPRRLRDRQLQVIRNGMRKTLKMEPVVGPPDAAMPPPDPEITRKLERAVGGDARALADLENVGLTALASLESQLARLGPHHSARVPLQSLASKLSTRVGEASIESDHWDISEDLQKRAAEFKEKPLDLKNLIGLTVALSKAWGDDQPVEIDVVADRLNDGRGVSLRILASPREGAGPKAATFRTSFQVTLGNETLLSSGASSFGGKGDEDSFEDLQRPVQKCLQAAHNLMFEIRIRCEFR